MIEGELFRMNFVTMLLQTHKTLSRDLALLLCGSERFSIHAH